MDVLHRGLGGGESESAISVSQLAGSGKSVISRKSRLPIRGKRALEVGFVFGMLAAMGQGDASED